MHVDSCGLAMPQPQMTQTGRAKPKPNCNKRKNKGMVASSVTRLNYFVIIYTWALHED
jgi:hypothetical protein